jgi:hypothetical protein
MSDHISFGGTGNGEKSESTGYPIGQQTTMPITPRGGPVQLKEPAHVIASDKHLLWPH